jgi:hypothetical protein
MKAARVGGTLAAMVMVGAAVRVRSAFGERAQRQA